MTMFFGQITHRESLRDTVTCLRAHQHKLYHLGFNHKISRAALAKANERRDFRIYSDLAQTLIDKARRLYVNDNDFSLEISNTVYALDATTIDLCLSVFWWAPFRKTKAAVKLHTMLDLRGDIPTFIQITDGKMHDVNILDEITFEPKAFYLMDKAYLDFERLFKINSSKAYFVTRAKKNAAFRRIYSRQVDKHTGLKCDQTIKLTVYKSAKSYPENLRRVKYFDKEQKKTYVFLTNNFEVTAMEIVLLYKHRWKIELFFQMDQTTFENQNLLGRNRKRCKNTNLDRDLHIFDGGNCKKRTENRAKSLRNSTDFISIGIRQNPIKPTT